MISEEPSGHVDGIARIHVWVELGVLLRLETVEDLQAAIGVG